jgi:hypothetical protein
MSGFVDECRREWKRLRVPDAAANEMAADLTADLREAEADGLAPEEVLGSGAFDPKAFAASWATERGLIQARPPGKGLRARPLLLAVLVVLLALLVAFVIGAVGLVFLASSSTKSAVVQRANAVPVPVATASVRVPDLVGVGQAQAHRVALAAGLAVDVSYRRRNAAQGGVVLSQNPPAGSIVPPGSTLVLVVAR